MFAADGVVIQEVVHDALEVLACLYKAPGLLRWWGGGVGVVVGVGVGVGFFDLVREGVSGVQGNWKI